MSGSRKERRGLGRGLTALMADVQLGEDSEQPATSGQPPSGQATLPIEALEPNPDQPRRDFHQQDLDSLASSIRQKGVLQPIIVRNVDRASQRYQIVAGERRWRAAQLAQVHSVSFRSRTTTGTE